MSSTPSVTVIVLNFNGKRHLEVCLPSIEALDYPNPVVMVADNGSSDGSVAWVRARHPGARIVEMGANIGFAAAYNRAVQQADTDYVVLLNNDTKVSPSWVTELVSAAERTRSAAAASAILDWDGSRVDFVGGLPTFIGHSWQVDYGQPVGRGYPERPLLFGCGASVLIRRDAYLEARGFDEDFFAYFEDVDLGWRMNLLGHSTVFAPKAVTYHRLHGTFGSLAHALRLRLYERNALAMIYKNYGDEALARVLPAAVALALARNMSLAKLEGDRIRFGVDPPERASIPSQLVALLIALEDFAQWLPALRAKRERIQATRRVADDQILALLPDPLKLHDLGDKYRDTAEALIRDFRITELFGLPAPARGTRHAAPGTPHPAPGTQAPGHLSTPTPGHPGTRAPGHPENVSVIVLTASGATHLPDCLDSLREHTWPAERTEVIVVDNGSAADPTSVAERHYPGVRVVRTGRNLGFSAGNNAGARVATGEWLVFLNDDTRVAPTWIAEMMAVAARRNAASVGALMVDWKGERLDFAGGLVNFEGRGYALRYDEPCQGVAVEDQAVLFGCGGAVMVRRDVFDSIGGWDEPTFAYYEDVELGWRLWLLGHEVWLAPKAVVYHKHHGTSGAESPARARAFERNALRMVYALLEESTLQQVLPTALLLASDRIVLRTPFSRANDGDPGGNGGLSLSSAPAIKASLRHALIQRGARRGLGVGGNLRKLGARGLAGAAWDAARDVRLGWGHRGARTRYLIEEGGQAAALEGRRERVDPMVLAALLGLEDFLDMLPELSERRAWLQSRRTRTDAEILGRFGDRWTAAVPSARLDLHDALRRQLMDVLGVHEGFKAR
jgi:GT2 family glycosyltransferase